MSMIILWFYPFFIEMHYYVLSQGGILNLLLKYISTENFIVVVIEPL